MDVKDLILAGTGFLGFVIESAKDHGHKYKCKYDFLESCLEEFCAFNREVDRANKGSTKGNKKTKVYSVDRFTSREDQIIRSNCELIY